MYSETYIQKLVQDSILFNQRAFYVPYLADIIMCIFSAFALYNYDIAQEQNNHLTKLITQVTSGVEQRFDDTKTFILLHFQKQLRSI